MKAAYPIIMTPVDGVFAVNVPDLDVHTEGTNIADAMRMARDAIEMWICFEEDKGSQIPTASELNSIAASKGETKTLVDIDADAYRRTYEKRVVRKNLTIPSWLNELAEHDKVNYSKVLQNALMEQLHVDDRQHRV